jgi:FkbM family methyltransferase
MKTFLKSLPLVGPAFKKLGELRWRYRCWKVDPARNLGKILRGCDDLFVVQIGSNDGTTGDPICSLLRKNPSWKALLVEPVPFLFERLRDNYRYNGNVRFDNVAIAKNAGRSNFYYVAAVAKEHIPDLPVWFDQLGSFDRTHITRHFGSVLDPFIVSAAIDTLPLSSVLARNHVTKIDVLHIDAEGYDWIVLQQLEQAKFLPKVIMFEHKHLVDNDKRAAVEFLENNYQITDLGSDYLCTCTQRS